MRLKEYNVYNFDRRADSYDKWYSTAEGAVYDILEKKAFDKLITTFDPGEKLLETGCGTGHWSKYFSEKDFKVTGIDISEKMIEKANGKHIPGCIFQVADTENLPFADNSFDAAAAITALEFTLNPEKAINEMVRCVRPGGSLLLGLLNAQSGYNKKRQQKEESVYSKARFYSKAELKEILAPYGKVKIQTAAFVIHSKGMIRLSPLYDWICRISGIDKGEFIAVKVEL